ncbi:MAG: OTU domain-containing protein [Chlamydiota bacterium]|nr:OTU domain-containing protein [Chlamydiota bacterium]
MNVCEQIKFYTTSIEDVVQQLVSDSDGIHKYKEKDLQISKILQSAVSGRSFEQLKGILQNSKIPLYGRVTFLKQIEKDLETNTRLFNGKIELLVPIRAIAESKLCLKHLEKEFVYFPTLSDGHCLFRSLSLPFESLGLTFQSFRDAVADFVKKNKEALKKYKEEDGGFADSLKDLQKYDEVIRKLEWGGIREIKIVATCMKRCIFIHSPNLQNSDHEYVPKIIDTTITGQEIPKNPETDIHLYWVGGSHYEYLDMKI